MKRVPFMPTRWEVLAFAAGLKTQFCRPLACQAWAAGDADALTDIAQRGRLPDMPASLHDVLCVQEAFKFRCLRSAGGVDDWIMDCMYRLDGTVKFLYECDAPLEVSFKQLCDDEWRRPRQMPVWATRLPLQIVDMRVEQLQSITEEAAQAEGVAPWHYNPDQCLTTGERAGDSPYRSGFALQWDEDHPGGPTWKSNPWVMRCKVRHVRVTFTSDGEIDPIPVPLQSAQRAGNPGIPAL